MNRSELINTVADKARISQRESERLVKIITDTITEQIAQGDKVTISGFGTFEKRRRKQTIARNPKTGERMVIKAQNTPTFRAGAALKSAVKEDVAEAV